jgi:hypothetical protein
MEMPKFKAFLSVQPLLNRLANGPADHQGWPPSPDGGEGQFLKEKPEKTQANPRSWRETD